MTRINHIEIVEEIASGGAARVYKAVNTHTGYLVAVKVLWNNLFRSEQVKQSFIEEANHYLYLDHPNIVKLKDFIQQEDASYLVMEYIEGQNLEEYINTVTGPIPEQKARAIMLKVLSGMQYAHEQQVLHLDLKPSNIMLTPRQGVKIIDFGIAAKSASLNNPTIMGSPLYMSPEQTEGKSIDTRSDIYSLGITFFQMLTGKSPFEGSVSREELFKKIRKGDVPTASSIYPFVSPESEAIIKKATQPDKEQRFASIKEFYEALNKMEV